MLYLVKTQALYWLEDGLPRLKLVAKYEIRNKHPKDEIYKSGIIIFKHETQERIKKYAALRNLQLEGE